MILKLMEFGPSSGLPSFCGKGSNSAFDCQTISDCGLTSIIRLPVANLIRWEDVKTTLRQGHSNNDTCASQL